MKITLADVRMSRLPAAIGLCSGNTPDIAEAVNAAQSRLVEAAGETGWWGGWVRVVFNVSASAPYITLPREFCRIINLAACDVPMRLHNGFYEVLPGGVGVQTARVLDWCGSIAGYERNPTPTLVDVTPGATLRAYMTDSADAGKKLLISGTDTNDHAIYAPDRSSGFYMTLADPFVDAAFGVNSISNVQKDLTKGDVVLNQIDPVTGVESTIARYGPTEFNPSYRRYIITALPRGCCTAGTVTSTVTVTAVCKRECLPIYQDTDQLLIQSIEALVEECKAIRLAGMEDGDFIKQSEYHHQKAIRLLQNQIRHYEGEQSPAVTVNIFQGAPLENKLIGTLI